ncbi:MAG: sulfatase-like hydrolase/transferase [Polyangiaceae bacterium]|nr:sulfatase-like hydrolase/transferase [Polyangiaceae bacterium]
MNERAPTAAPHAPPREGTQSITRVYTTHAADVFSALCVFALVEIVVVGLLAWTRFAGPYEIGRSVRRLWPLSAAAAVLPSFLLAAVTALLVRGAERGARVSLAALATVAAAATAFGVSTGRHFEAFHIRFAFVAAAALVGGGVSYVVMARLASAFVYTKRSVLLVALFVGAGLLSAANVLILPRLYPAFHTALGALTLMVAALFPIALRRQEDRKAPVFSLPRVVATVLAALTVVALARPSAQALALADNIRMVYIERAPLLSNVVRLAAELSPPAPVDDTPTRVMTAGRSIDLSGRDLVLISIDALRADHMGTYGYTRPTTPRIDALAKQGVVFEAAYTATPHTSYAITSLMTGKYMRPLLLQGLGADSETWPQHLRRYGYKTAAFYPPAVFFIDGEKFAPFRESFLGFEYRKVEFASAQKRVDQVNAYLSRTPADRKLFLWVHLFEPHEPYEAHPELCASEAPLRNDRCTQEVAFGERDVDRYDAEIAAADAGVGQIVDAIRRARPNAVVMITADHGEELGDHGGRYHGTTVYEEQVRVPLIVYAPGLLAPRRVSQPVQIIDLLPTVLSGLDIPRPARVRGADLGPLLVGKPPPTGFEDGFAFAETDEQTLLARGTLRLVCARKVGACALYDLAKDPGQTKDDPTSGGAIRDALRSELVKIAASHGTFETSGLRSEGKGLPPALRRAIGGDVDAAPDVAALLDDADVVIRRKAAEVLFDLKRPETAAALRLSIVRDEDAEVKTRASLALTRLGEGAARTREVLDEPDVPLRRLAALALAEQGDKAGEAELIAWWRRAFAKEPGEREPLAESRAKEILAALGKLKSKDAVVPLILALGEVRLRPSIAHALAAIGEDAARPALAAQLEEERYQDARVAIVNALLTLGAEDELARPLARLLGMPDPLPNGLEAAIKAGVLQHVGGPRPSDQSRLVRLAKAGAPMRLVVPKTEKFPKDRGVRAICRARTIDQKPGSVRIGRVMTYAKGRYSAWIPKQAPELDPDRSVELVVAPTADPNAFREPYATLPAAVELKQGDLGEFVVYTSQNVEVTACAVVALQEELPPPPPQSWTPGSEEDP